MKKVHRAQDLLIASSASACRTERGGSMQWVAGNRAAIVSSGIRKTPLSVNSACLRDGIDKFELRTYTMLAGSVPSIVRVLGRKAVVYVRIWRNRQTR